MKKRSNYTSKTLLAIIDTDNTFKLIQYRSQMLWQGKCIHCNRKLLIHTNGSPMSDATIEHIRPSFKGGTDDLRNLAIACAECNHEKGRRHDNKKNSKRAKEVVENLLKKRMSRWKEPSKR